MTLGKRIDRYNDNDTQIQMETQLVIQTKGQILRKIDKKIYRQTPKRVGSLTDKSNDN